MCLMKNNNKTLKEFNNSRPKKNNEIQFFRADE